MLIELVSFVLVVVSSTTPVPYEEAFENWFINEFGEPSASPIPAIPAVNWEGDGKPIESIPDPSELQVLLAFLRKDGALPFGTLLDRIRALHPATAWTMVEVEETVKNLVGSISVPLFLHTHLTRIVSSGINDVQSVEFRTAITRLWRTVAPGVSLTVLFRISSDWVQFCINAPPFNCFPVLFQGEMRWVLSNPQILSFIRHQQVEAAKVREKGSLYHMVRLLVVTKLETSRTLSDSDMLSYVNMHVRNPVSFQQVVEIRNHVLNYTRVSLLFHRILVSLFAFPVSNPANISVPDELVHLLKTEYPFDYELRMKFWFVYCIEPLRQYDGVRSRPCIEEPGIDLVRLGASQVAKYLRSERVRLQTP